jgi:hypothetical protein
MQTTANNPKANPPDDAGLVSDAAPTMKSKPATAQPMALMRGPVRDGSA